MKEIVRPSLSPPVSHTVSHTVSQLVSQSVTQSLSNSMSHSVTQSLSIPLLCIQHPMPFHSLHVLTKVLQSKSISLSQYLKWLFKNHKIITSKDHPPTRQPSSLSSSSLSAPKGFSFFFLEDGL